MAEEVLWVDRTWEIGLPDERFEGEVLRLESTPDRIGRLIRDLPLAELVRRENDRWSILENAGHLLDLDELMEGRLDDFQNDVPVLRTADMTNRKSHEAGHNEREPAELLADFRASRERLVQVFRTLDPAVRARRIMHPRLGQPMRPVDLAHFHAEHDDHHLARIERIAQRVSGAPR